MATRFQIAWMVSMMANAVIFGVGLVPVLLIPSLAQHAFTLVPAVVIASFILSPPLSWLIAPRLQARYWKKREQQEATFAHG